MLDASRHFAPHNRTQPRLVALTAYASVAAAVALLFLLRHLTHNLQGAGLAPLEIGFWRLLLVGGALALHAAASRRALPRRDDAPSVVALALVGVSLFYAAFGFPHALGWLYALPAALGVGAWLLLGRATALRKANLLLAALVALLLLAGWREGSMFVHLLPPLLLGVACAGYLLIGRGLFSRYAPVSVYAVALPLAAVSLLPLVSFAPKTPLLWLELGLLALLSSYLAYSLYYLAMSHLGLARDLLATTAEPVVALLLVLLLFGLDWPVFLGAAVISSLALAVPLKAADASVLRSLDVRRLLTRRRAA
jgi:drug/metabolite transporter, DME family